jgi:hypothetical protein
LQTSANEYLNSISNPTSRNTYTIKRDRNVIQAILRKCIPYFKIEKIKIRISFFKPKTFLSEKQVDEYLNILRKENRDLYFAQYLQYQLGLRINSDANFKKKNLLFTSNPEEYKVEIYDTKTHKDVPLIKEVKSEVMNEVNEYLIDKDPEDLRSLAVN